MITVSHLHCILRPDNLGNWSIQNDTDHMSIGIYSVSQLSNMLVLYFDHTYTHAGTIQITTDDDFAGSITANAGLGLSAAGISLRAAPNLTGDDPVIDPKDIWNYLTYKGGGNLWVNITMVDSV